TTGKPPNGATPTVKLEVDGRAAGEVKLDGTAGDAARNITFSQRFPPGSHLVTLKCDGDDFTEDNRQDFALEVLAAVPVLIVDGAPRRAEFLRDALAPAKDATPAFAVKIISAAEFSEASLATDMRGPGTSPRVVVFSNVSALTNAQNASIEKY